MRILFLATDAYGGRGGIAYYNRGLIEALAAMPKVREIVVLVRRFQSPAGKMPAKVSLVTAAAGGKPRYLVATLFQLLKSCDFLICGHVNLLPLAGAIVRLKRVPLVLQVHGIDVWRPVDSARRWLARVDAVWTVSSVTRDRMNEWAKLPVSKYAVIPNTIHPERYGLAPKRPELLDRYGLKDHKIIVSMGRLSSSERYKGFDEILESMPALLEREPSLSYLILGDGDDRSRLEAKAKSLGITGRVHFAGYVSEQEKADHLRLGDVFAMPGRGEGFGIVYLEAMACGIPVVGSHLDGSRDALRNGLLGELVNPDDSVSVKEGILKAMAKPRQIPDGLEYFAWSSFTRRVREAVMEIMEKSTTNSATVVQRRGNEAGQ